MDSIITKGILGIALLLYLWIMYIIYKFARKEEKNLADKLLSSSEVMDILLNHITENEFEEELDDVLYTELFTNNCKEKLLTIFNYDLESNVFDSYIKNNKLNTTAFKNSMENIIKDSDIVHSMFENMLLERMSRNIDYAIEVDKIHMEFVKEFDDESDEDLELHPIVSNSNELETEDDREITLADISSTGTVEDL